MPSDYMINKHLAKLGLPPQSVTWSAGPLTLEEVEKYFTVPIAEASQKLFVCTTALKRVCKENGIPRWPYRKLMAGKTIEDIKREAVREIELSEDTNCQMSVTVNITNPALDTRIIPPGSSHQGAKLPVVSSHSDAKLQAGMAPSKHTQQQSPAGGSTPAASPLNPVSSRVVPVQTPQKQKVVPTHLDDFKMGFPSKGLGRASSCWWGSGEKDPLAGGEVRDNAGREDETLAMGAAVNKEDDADYVTNAEEDGADGRNSTTPSSLLVRNRKKAATNRRKAMKHAFSKGYSMHLLGEKDATTLRFVFGDQLPRKCVSFRPPLS